MLVSSIIKRYTNEYGGPINCIMSIIDNKKFNSFIKKVLPPDSHIFSPEDSIFAHNPVDIIICNNKINDLEKCSALSYFLHCPLLIIDHDTKPAFIENDILEDQSNSVYNIAINYQIKSSWWNRANAVMNYDIDDPDSLEHWYNSLYQISRIPFSLKSKQKEIKEEENEQK